MASKTKTTHEYGTVPEAFNPDASFYHKALLKCYGTTKKAIGAIKLSKIIVGELPYIDTPAKKNVREKQRLQVHTT